MWKPSTLLGTTGATVTALALALSNPAYAVDVVPPPPDDTPSPDPTVATVTSAPAPAPQPPDITLGGLRAGYALFSARGAALTGPAFGLSYAFQSGSLQVGFQPFEIGWAHSQGGASAFGVKFLRFEGAYTFRPTANVSAYAGGGIGIGTLFVADDGYDLGGGGFEIPIVAGLELLRQQPLRFTLEAEGVLPLYRLEDALDQPAGWPITLGLRVGVAVKMRRNLAEIIEPWLKAAVGE